MSVVSMAQTQGVPTTLINYKCIYTDIYKLPNCDTESDYSTKFININSVN